MTATQPAPPTPPADSPAGPSWLPGLRAHLFALVFVVLAPALLFGAVASWAALRRQDEAQEARLLDTAQALAAAVDAQIGASIAALSVLAATPGIDGEDGRAELDHLRVRALATAQTLGTSIYLYRPDGTAAMHASSADAAPDLSNNRAAIARAFATGRPVVSDVIADPRSGPPVAFVFVPLPREGASRGVLGMLLPPEELSDTLRGQATRGEGAAALTDGRGVLVARSREPRTPREVTRLPQADNPPNGAGVLRGHRVADGAPIRIAYQPLDIAPGWHVWVNEPEATFAEARNASLRALAGGTALALLLGLLGAMLVARQVLSPMRALVRRAEAVAGGEVGPEDAPEVPPAQVAEFERLRRAVTGAEAALRRVQRIGRVGGFEVDLRPQARLSSHRSAEYAELHGLTRRDDGHADWLRRLHPADRERAERHFLACVSDASGATEYEQEYRIVLPGGGVRWIFARGEIERDAKGRATRLVGAHVDVTATKTAEAALRDSEQRLRLALEAAQLGAWQLDLMTGDLQRTARSLEIFGFGPERAGEHYLHWRDHMHPDDREPLAAAMEAVIEGRQPAYRVEFRFQRPDGHWIWVEAHGRATGVDPLTGRATGIIGTTLDITERKEAEQRQEVLVHELDHRAKNTLAIVQAALRLTPRTDPESYARAVEGRVSALARAHTLLARGRWGGAGLRVVAEEALAPFLGGDLAGPDAVFEGPHVALSPPAVQAMSMALHELATNAAKHGALSVPGGRVAMSWRIEGEALHLCWREEGGPAVVAPPKRRGFGSSLIEATIARQMNARMSMHWHETGLVWEAVVPLDRLRPGAREAQQEGGGVDEVADASLH